MIDPATLNYLDNNATTKPLPEVVRACHEALERSWANPSSIHEFGRDARVLVDHAREQVASLLNARASEIIFTSCATESINAALKGVIAATASEQRRMIITAVEHEAVIEVAEELAKAGTEVVILGVDRLGHLDLDQLDAELSKGAALVSLMFANNETGVIFPIAEVCRRARAAGAQVHVDAVQGVGRHRLDVASWGCDFLSLSAHKFHGPKGAGVLYANRSARWRPLLTGSSHEGGRRGGTESVPAIVGLGVAAEHMAAGIPERAARMQSLGERLEKGLLALPGTHLNGDPDQRLPGVVNVGFEGIEGAGIVLSAGGEGVCLSSGSACTAGLGGGSHVLKAMGVPFDQLHGALRVSLCEHTTESEVDRALAVIGGAVASLRGMTAGGAGASAS